MRGSLEHSYAKLKRAEEQVGEFADRFGDWASREPWTVKGTDAGTVTHWAFQIEDFPPKLGAIAEDVFNNSRAPLDKALTAYAERCGIGVENISFPTGKSQAHYLGAVAKLRERFGDDPLLQELDGIEPYLGGRDAVLFHLHRLDVMGKHHPFLMPANLYTEGFDMQEIVARDGRMVFLGSRRGQHLKGRRPFGSGPNHLHQPKHDRQPKIEKLKDRIRIVFQSPADDFEFMTTTRGATFSGDFSLHVGCHLLSPDGVNMGPAEQAMRDMIGAVRAVLDGFRDRLFV